MLKSATFNKVLFYLKDTAKQMWFRCCVYCIFALLAFFIGPTLGHFVPDSLKEIVSKDALRNILQVIASSMLAVTTFSLSIMVQAFTTASTTATPRASKLLTEDRTAQNALGSFIGAFLFSIVGIIGISAGLYSEDILVILFFSTIVMIVIIVVMLLRWIGQLSKLGRVSVTIDLVEQSLMRAIDSRGQHPTLKAQPLHRSCQELSQKFTPVVSSQIGYIQYFDVEKLNEIASEHDAKLFISVNSGEFIDSINPVAFVDKELRNDVKQAICDAIIVGQDRTFSQDPRYGFVILAEIALRALSPGINDPGTAIDITGTYVRCMRKWYDRCRYSTTSVENSQHLKYERVYIRPIDIKDLISDMFCQLVKEGASHILVVKHILATMDSISAMGHGETNDAIEHWKARLQEAAKLKLTELEFAGLAFPSN